MIFFGVTAKVYLNYRGELKSLASNISDCLLIPSFYFESDESPPHEIVGNCEVLGSQLWLKNDHHTPGFSFSLELETELSLEEVFKGNMYDISPWLARYLSKICKVESGFMSLSDSKIVRLVNGESQV